jgi:hypothetical protein
MGKSWEIHYSYVKLPEGIIIEKLCFDGDIVGIIGIWMDAMGNCDNHVTPW